MTVPNLEMNRASAMDGKTQSLHAGFVHQAMCGPDNAALIVGNRTYTYSEASEIARRWAARLIDAAGGRPRRVGVFAYRSEVSYLGVLAALFSGAAFVPLNRKFPIERTRAMLEQADVDALIVDNESLPQLHEVLRGMKRPPALLLPATDKASLAREFATVVFDRLDLLTATPLATLPTVTSRRSRLPAVHVRQHGRAGRRADHAWQRARIPRCQSAALRADARGSSDADLRPDVRSLRVRPVHGLGQRRLRLRHAADRDAGAVQVHRAAQDHRVVLGAVGRGPADQAWRVAARQLADACAGACSAARDCRKRRPRRGSGRRRTRSSRTSTGRPS